MATATLHFYVLRKQIEFWQIIILKSYKESFIQITSYCEIGTKMYTHIIGYKKKIFK
jgi:hypothetical protein